MASSKMRPKETVEAICNPYERYNGRYVVVLVPMRAKAFLSLCEVEVYASYLCECFSVCCAAKI